MSRLLDKYRLGHKYPNDELMGIDAGDFLPYIGMLGKSFSSLGGGGGQAAGGAAANPAAAQQQQALLAALAAQQQQQALAQQNAAQQARDKQVADAAKIQMLTYGLVGAVVLGGLYFFMVKKK